MNEAPPTLTARLTNWIHAGRRSMPRSYDPSPYDQSPSDLDGACPACDYPFGRSNHVCIGAVTRIAM
jgi:hypothetical protein